MKVIDGPEVARQAQAAYGIDATDQGGVHVLELIASSLRRAASYLAPARKGRIVRATLRALEGVIDEDHARYELMSTMLDTLVANGDLIELKTEGVRNIYLGPPQFVRLSDDIIILLGVRPHGAPFVGERHQSSIRHHGGLRFLRPQADIDALDVVRGFHEQPREVWLAGPSKTTPASHVSRYTEQLSAARASGPIPDLRILDSAHPTTHYAGRWRPPQPSDNGMFVGRRHVEYGADAWSVVLLDQGECQKVIDLPLSRWAARGCDEAWLLQLAIDSVRGAPQVVRRSLTGDGDWQVNLDGPLPAFAIRFLESVGELTLPGRGALISFLVSPRDAAAVAAFAKLNLWMATDEGITQS